MSRRNPGRGDQLRAAIAQEAARLMAEHGIHDFGLAKRKAAERFGVTSEGAVLPRNVEIEDALRERQRLFGQGEHEHELQRLRRSAVNAMKLLSLFQPRLVGPVLNGTATEHSDVLLHLFADSPEAIYLSLLDRQVPYEVFERRLRLTIDRQAVALPGVRFEVGGQTIEAIVFQRDGIRQAPLSPVDGRPMKRADLAEVLDLVHGAAEVDSAARSADKQGRKEPQTKS